MTEREKDKIAQVKEFCFARDGYACRNCGESIHTHGSPQLAHGIANTKTNLKIFGKEIIHHPDNLFSTCCIRCNDAMNIGRKPAESRALADSIRRKLDAEKEYRDNIQKTIPNRIDAA